MTTPPAGPRAVGGPSAPLPPAAADLPAAVADVVGGTDPADLSVVPLAHGRLNQATGGVWRATGPRGSAVLKLCVPGGSGAFASGSDPRHWNHWRREPLAYAEGLTATAFGDAGIEGPRLLSRTAYPDGSLALWLEDVRGLPGARWPVPRLAAFARALGAAQARWTDRVPDRPWLSRRWLRQYVTGQPLPAEIPWDHPTAAAVWPAALRSSLRRLWEQRELLLRAAESGPRTLCHLDVWPHNLISAGDGRRPDALPDAFPGAARGTAPGAVPGERTVLLDWAFVGEGGVGEDIANLIPDCVADGLMPTEQLPEISEAVITGYLDGLRAAGLPTEEGTLRRSVAAAGAAKYCWLAPLMLTRLAAGAPVGSISYDVGGDDTAVLRRRTGLFQHLVDWSADVLPD